MSLTADQVRWVAQLARLELSRADVETMTSQLSAITDFVQQLQAVNTEGVLPLAHPLPLENVFRDDSPASVLPVAQALANAPRRKGDYYVVPAVLD